MSTDKKYNRATYTGLGQGMQDRLIEGAYLSARADSPDYSWMNVIGGGIKSFKEEVDTAKANKKAEREETLAGIQTTVDGIYEAGGSMPKVYFDQAYDYTEQLRERYIAAVESGDIKAQHQIKGELNGFSTTIQSTKDSLVEGAELWNDSSLIDKSGMTDYQLAVNASFKEENAQLVEGSYKWKNVNYDPSNPNSKEFFTLDDYKEALPLRDDVNKEVYLKDGQNVLDAREQWLNGDGGEFDVNTQRKKNIKIIDDSIKSVGTMQSMVHDDITGQGSFASSLQDHPEFKNIFDAINNKDGLKNQTAIALYDQNKDGTVDFRDYIDYDDPNTRGYLEVYFDDFDNNISFSDGIDDTERAYMKTPEFLEQITKMMNHQNFSVFRENIETMAKENLSDAILNQDNPKYSEDVTKGLLADFMTNRQSQMFYGGDERYKTLIPGVDGSVVRIKRGKLYIGSDQITDAEDYKKKGGSLSHLDKAGWTWNNTDKKFEYNANWGKEKRSY
jgi:hypothetical protein